jgi:hypothetical protein
MAIILWIAFVLLVGLYICGPIADPDLFWHLTAGRWILANGQVPTVDYWNMFGVGQPWLAYSWSFEVVVAYLDLQFGVAGLAILKILFAVSLALTLCLVMSLLARDWFFGLLIGTLTTLACHNHFTLRPQSLTWILLALLILCAERLVRNRSMSLKNALCITILFSLWANLHITTALGLVIGVTWVLVGGGLRLALLYAVIGITGTLLTPYLGAEWLTFLSKTSHPLQHASIAEFQPATILQYSTGFLLIVAGLQYAFLFMVWQTREPSKQRDFIRGEIPLQLLAGGFLLGALAVVKFIPIAAILFGAITCRLWRAIGHTGLPLQEAILRLRSVIARIPREGLTFVVLVLAFLEGWRFWQGNFDTRLVPVEAMDVFINEQLPQPLLNDFGRGGYVMYRMSNRQGEPSMLVSIDGRTNVTPHEVFEEYLASFQGKENWGDFIRRVDAATILWRLDSPLVSILKSGGEWCEVFRSGSGALGHILFVRRDIYTEQFAHLLSVDCSIEPERSMPERSEPEIREG